MHKAQRRSYTHTPASNLMHSDTMLAHVKHKCTPQTQLYNRQNALMTLSTYNRGRDYMSTRLFVLVPARTTQARAGGKPKCCRNHTSTSIASAITYSKFHPSVRWSFRSATTSSQGYGCTHTLPCNFTNPARARCILSVSRTVLRLSFTSNNTMRHFPSQRFCGACMAALLENVRCAS